MFKSIKTYLVVIASGLGLALALAGVQPAAAAVQPAKISLSSVQGLAWSVITVTGSGFKASTTGTVVIGSASYALKTTSTGAFRASARVPVAATGRVTVTAKTLTVQASAVFTVVAPTISNAKLRFGAATAGGPLASRELDQMAVYAGEAPSSVLFFKDFAQPAPITEMNAVRARGAVPLVTWEPWLWGGGVNQPAYSLARIAAGDFDAYITQWGRALASWGSPVQLRFAHEMNGDWYPWAESANGNRPGDYVRAWRHVHDLVAAQGASNVSWVWSPNVPSDGFTSLAQLYPGAGYVDVVALDGYNWGTSASWSGWTSPQDLFAPGIAQLRSLAPGVPILIAETASSDAGGDKAAWNTALVSYLAAQPDVMGFVWFNIRKEADWRISSSTSSAAAFKNALQARRTS